MRLVPQEHIDGCAVACLAMVTGESYELALKVLHPDLTPDTFSAWTSNESLLEAIKRAGRDVVVYPPKPLKDLGPSILLVRYHIGDTPFMHVVVWDPEKDQVLDPFVLQKVRPNDYYERNMCLAYEFERLGPPRTSTTHILHGARTLCGMLGVPRDWPKGHFWVSLRGHNDRKDATCPTCVEVAATAPLE